MRSSIRLLALTTIFTCVPEGVYAQQNAATQGQAGQAQARTNAASQAMFGQINQNPFFLDPAIRAQLNVNAQQAQLLNQQHVQLWNVYLKTQSQFNNAGNLTDAQRLRQLQAANQYYGDFNTATVNILSPDQRARLSQLTLQYRGYQALNDPFVTSQLQLNNEQVAKIRQYQQGYDEQLAKIYQLRATDINAFTTQLGQLSTQMASQINSLLTQDQQQKWQTLMGRTHNFNYAY